MTSCADVDQALVEEVRTLRQAIPASPRFTWDFRYAKLCDRITIDGCLDDMLSWPTVREALFAGQTSLARQEFLALPNAVRELSYDAPYPPLPSDSQHKPSGTYIRQAHVVHLLSQVYRVGDLETLYEVGGGYGALAVTLVRFGFRGTHYVLDHPVMDTIREAVLRRLSVKTERAPRDKYDVYDAVIGVHSLCEIEPNERAAILERALAKYCYVFSITKEFDGIDNLAWFSEWFRDNRLDYAIHDLPSRAQVIMRAVRR